jgi:site-specific DNA-methyltransferase (adenine-specific)
VLTASTLNRRALFGRASDEWRTPPAFYAALDAEFHFTVDAAATSVNHLAEAYYGPDHPSLDRRDALSVAWGPEICFLNPPYSRCRDFMTAAARAVRNGATVVCLVPARTDTRWFHEIVWNEATHQLRPGCEVRFLKGRLRFSGDGTVANSAPFPSVVVVLHPGIV